ncbi:hypothetical protein J6590_053664 [Homalodisca vitripennis]|nr:hypothetical protein J6590_053664 [Homalodisca vitripennis]
MDCLMAREVATTGICGTPTHICSLASVVTVVVEMVMKVIMPVPVRKVVVMVMMKEVVIPGSKPVARVGLDNWSYHRLDYHRHAVVHLPHATVRGGHRNVMMVVVLRSERTNGPQNALCSYQYLFSGLISLASHVP